MNPIEPWLHPFLGQLDNAVLVLDEGGVCVFANRAAGQSLGCASEADLVGATIEDHARFARSAIPSADGIGSDTGVPIDQTSQPLSQIRLRLRDRTALNALGRLCRIPSDEFRNERLVVVLAAPGGTSMTLPASVIDDLGEAFALWGPDDRLVFWNRRYEAWMQGIGDSLRPGVGYENLLKAALQSGLFVVDGPPDEWLAHVLERHRQGDLEDVQHLADGRWVRIRERRMTDGTTVALWVDVTALNQASESLAFEHTLWQSLIDAVPDLIFYKDRSRTYQRCNRALAELMGRDSSEIVGKGDENLFTPDNAETMRARDSWVLDTGKPLRIQESATYPDGRTIPVDTLKTPVFDDDGNVRGLIGISRNVSEQKEAERALLHAKRSAESATRAKSDFLARMSHELRTPLTGILGVSELLLATSLTPEQRQSMINLRASAEGLHTLLNELLDFSKIDAGRLALEESDFDLDGLLESVRTAHDLEAIKKGITLSFPRAGAAYRWLRGDAGRLRSIVSHLVSNAVKFTHQGTVSVTVSGRRQGRNALRLRVEVTDTGIGMTRRQQSKLFHPFVQGEASTVRRYGGAGLGLALCHRLVTAMRGTIGAKSEPDHGSTFWFEVRLKPGRPVSGIDVQPAPALQDTGMTGLLRVLVVDDHDINRELIGRLLKGEGHSVDLAESGRTAVLAVKNQAFDLVLMDMHMPDTDGLTAARMIRLLHGDKSKTPIVALTADTTPVMRRRAAQLGLNGYLTKPVRRADLRECLAQFAAGPVPDPEPAANPATESPAHAAEPTLEPGDDGPVLAPDDTDIDPTVLSGLAEQIGWTPVIDLLRRLQLRLSDDTESLREALASGDIDVARITSHNLKGAAGLLGCRKVMWASADLHDALADRARAVELHGVLEQSIVSANSAIEAFIASR